MAGFPCFLRICDFKGITAWCIKHIVRHGGSLVSSTFGAKVAGSASGISEILSANFTQAQGLAFIFAISFNMPCISALAATARETPSVKWTAKIGAFYTVAALIVSCIVYHIGLLIF